VEPAFSIWLAGMGLILGSFLNVVIARLPHGESVVRPRSKCPKCGAQLAWYDNIPVVSWLVLRGKCRNCKAPISPRYILVELLTGSLFMACLARFGWTWPLVSALTLVVLLVPLVFIDAEYWVLPFELTLPGIALGVLLRAPLGLDAVTTAALGVAAGFVLFRVMEFAGWAVTGREALGAGDKYLVAMVLGFLGWRALLAVVLLASLQAAVVGIVRMRLTGKAHADAADDDGGDDDAPARQKWTPAFLKPGLPAWKRVALVPWALLFQDVPDPELDESTGEDTWEPQANNLPFGPWIGLAALEVMLLGPWLATQLHGTAFELHGQLLFG
jgi:leader peptidase (prepilin peptidase)/N-methyltransferase